MYIYYSNSLNSYCASINDNSRTFSSLIRLIRLIMSFVLLLIIIISNYLINLVSIIFIHLRIIWFLIINVIIKKTN